MNHGLEVEPVKIQTHLYVTGTILKDMSIHKELQEPRSTHKTVEGQCEMK